MSNPFDDAQAAFATADAVKPKTEQAKPEGLPLETVSAPGEYDIREDSYHADPCPEPSLSGSLIKVFARRSPRHAWAAHPRLNPEFEREEKDSFDLGTAFHKLVLEKGCELVLCDFKDWRTDAAKAAKASCRAEGRIPLLPHQFEQAEAMARAAKAQVRLWEELHIAMAGGIPERTYVWQEETPFGSIWCRCMVDWTPHSGHLAPDWKSTDVGAGPDEWGAKTLWNMDAHIQAAWNARALKKAGGRDLELFFAVTECEFPHALACCKPTNAALAMAERDIERAIIQFAWCMKNNHWPAYRPTMAYVDPPGWMERTFLEREERNELDIGQTVQLLELAAEGRAAIADQPTSEATDAFGLEPIKGLDA